MKNFKKFSAAIAATLVAASISVPMMASLPASASEYVITIGTTTESGSTVTNGTYTAYRIFDLAYNAEKTAYTYTVSAECLLTEAEIFGAAKTAGATDDDVTDINTLTTWLNAAANSAANTRAFANALWPLLKDKTGITSSADNKIDVGTAGYYLIAGSSDVAENETVTSLVALTSTDPTVTVTPKLDAPTLTKEIQHNELEPEGWGNVGDNQIGDTVNYKITTTMPDPNYVKQFGTNGSGYTYTIHDDMSKGLTFDVSSVVVTIGNETLVLGEDYTINTACTHTGADEGDGETGFEIVFNMANVLAKHSGVAVDGASIVTKYSCTLNKDARVATGSNDGTNHNDNTSHLEYSNNPYDTSKTETTPDIEVYDWTFIETVTKIDGNGNNLAGAVFEIYDGSDRLSFLKDVASETYTVVPSGTDGAVTQIASVSASGFTLKGLDDKTEYTVKEVSTPSGYTGASDKTFTLTANYNPAGSTLTTLVDDGKADDNTADNNLNIINTSGSQLPGTGGIGTAVFYIGGGCMVALAGVFLITKKRMGKKED